MFSHRNNLILRIEEIVACSFCKFVNADSNDSNLTDALPYFSHNVHGSGVDKGDKVTLMSSPCCATPKLKRNRIFVHLISRGQLLSAFLLCELQPLASEVCWLQVLLSFFSPRPL